MYWRRPFKHVSLYSSEKWLVGCFIGTFVVDLLQMAGPPPTPESVPGLGSESQGFKRWESGLKNP
ncbi:hypothetical protein CROQUDRAFT_94446 [Cronartium quercuum f. sp. fusiforme G11]|uniref:Uncharacterized protein n=1 Tax=Cronartium quercuum f. sp. fusiforme G11 TaxID=708437 RepID=A0A9P6NG56_9BASI|nr:hypothetical protein CROQUDRAFT_94446 [Cronartium quercuum f. sp. fusiforme G11]